MANFYGQFSGFGSGGAVADSGWQGAEAGYHSGSANPGSAATTNGIGKYSYASDGASVDTANLSVARGDSGGSQSATHGYISGGGDQSSGFATYGNVIDKHQYATTNDATDVGDLTLKRHTVNSTCSETFGYTAAGHYGPRSNIIEKFSYTSDGNATDVGNLTVARNTCGNASSLTHGYCAGGYSTGFDNTIDKYSFTSDGNAANVGDLTVARQSDGGASSKTHGYCIAGGGTPNSDVIEKWSFDSDGNATDVGDVVVPGYGRSGTSSTTHGYACQGWQSAPISSLTNAIDKFSFSSDGDATDVGDAFEAGSGGGGHHV